jgi:hypothetical protein
MQAAIRRVWVLENMAKIGPGGFYHLAYAHSQSSPELLREIRHTSDYGKIHIYLLGDDDHALHVADGEVIAIHWFPEFIRIHFMIAVVRDIDIAARSKWGSEYMLKQ